jgi:hypothetical protein
MPGIARRSYEVEALVEAPGSIVFRVDGKRTNARDLRSFKGTEHRVLENSGAQALSLRICRNGEASEHHDGHGMTGQPLRQALRRVVVLDLTNHKRVVADDLFVAGQSHPSARRACLLALKRVPNQKPIEGLTTTVKRVNIVSTLHRFNTKRCHLKSAAIKDAGFFEKLRGSGRRPGPGRQCSLKRFPLPGIQPKAHAIR